MDLDFVMLRQDAEKRVLDPGYTGGKCGKYCWFGANWLAFIFLLVTWHNELGSSPTPQSIFFSLWPFYFLKIMWSLWSDAKRKDLLSTHAHIQCSFCQSTSPLASCLTRQEEYIHRERDMHTCNVSIYLSPQSLSPKTPLLLLLLLQPFLGRQINYWLIDWYSLASSPAVKRTGGKRGIEAGKPF